MERSRKILLEISSVSQQVITAANKYADRKGLRCVPRTHVQLEQDMYRISAACNAFADSLISPSLSDPPGIDITLQDWLCTEEPRFCLDTLTRMIKLLQTDTSFWTMLNPWRLQPAQDRIKEAVELLELCKNYFYFLFSTEILDNERGAEHQGDVPQSEHRLLTERSEICSESSVASTQSSIGIAILNSPVGKESEYSNCVVDKGEEPESGKEREKRLKRVAKKREGILKWLDRLNCAEKQDMTLKLRQLDTCKWLFDTAQYKTWWNSETSCFWLRGKPGAGKSVLASSVIESLEKIQREGSAYFYCDFRNERSTNASEVFRSLLSQLLLQIPDDANDLEGLVDDILHAKDRGGATWKNTVELAGYVSRTAELFAKEPWAVVDALDECKDVEELLDGLVALKGHVRLFLTSRPLQLIKSGLSDFLGISMEDMAEELSADIGLHVTRELANRRRLRDLDADIKTDIHTLLCHRADGMFRWVECSIDTLNRCVTLEGVQRALRNLPKGLEETYKRILLGINVATDEGKLALRALVWLVAALRPLKIQELMEGLSIDLGKRVIDFGLRPMHREALLDACGSLVTYSEKTGIIILSHFSVKEYLISELTRAELPEYHIDLERAHLQVVQLCICYVSICLNGVREPKNFSIMPTGTLARKTSKCVDLSRLVLWRLRDYVFDDAIDHFQCLQVGPLFGLLLDDITVLADVIKQHQLLWDNMCLSAGRVMGTTNPCWPTSNHDLVLYILVAFSPDSFLHAYLRRTVLKPKEGVNPLVYAAYFNKELHARILLSRGVKLNRRGWEVVGPHRALPFEVALDNRHFAMLTLFVTEGSPVPASIFPLLFHEDNRGPPIPNSVRAVLLQTEDFVEAVYDLNKPFLPSLRRLFEMTKLETFGWESHVAIRRWLQVAEERGYQSLLIESLYQDSASKILKFLVNCGYGPLFSNSFIIEALHIALQKGHASVVKYLLSLRHDIPFPPDILALALNSPSLRDTDRASLTSLLIENGAYVRTRPLIAQCSPLRIALWIFSDEDALHITKLLIRHGCDPLEVNYPGDSLLRITARRGHILVTQHLLSIGVPLPPDILFAMFDSQISHIMDHTPMVRLLIESGADIHARPYSVLCAPLCSLEGDDALQTTKLLVNYGCDLLQVDSEGNSPLHIAIKYGRTSVVQYLLSLGILQALPSDILSFTLSFDILISTFNLRLVRAVSMACLLIEHGADVHTRISTGDSLLPTVLQLLREDDALALKITKLSIDHGFDPLEVDSRGESILHIAVKQFHTSVVHHLLSIGVCLPPDILLVASHSEPRSEAIACKISTISLLIENGGDVHACTPAGDSVLHIALQSRLSDDHALHITKLLLNHGFDLLKADSPRKSLLRIAVESFNTSVVQYLVSLGVYLPPDILLSTLRSPRHVTDEESMVRLRVLLECGADIHACTSDGNLALHVLLESFDMSDAWAFRITELFVSHHFDPIEADPSGRSLLHIVSERLYLSVARYLLSLHIPIPPDILLHVLQRNLLEDQVRVPMFCLLIENGADVHACTPARDPLLHSALNVFRSEDAVLTVTKVLVNRGYSTLQVNSDGKSILHIAVEHSYISVMQYLLSLGVPLPRDILFCALQWKDRCQLKELMVSLLIEHGADVQTCTPGGDSALHIALKSSYSGIRMSRSDYSSSALRIMKILVHQGCDPLQVDFPVNSLLRIAIKWDSDSESYSESATRYLLSLGISPPPDILLVAFGSVPTLGETFDKMTTNARQRKWNWEVQCLAPVDCLIENGANVHASTPEGDSVLHIMLRRSTRFSEDSVLQITKFLVGHGFDPRKVDSPANSLLHIAVQRCYTSAARYLLSFYIPFTPDSLPLELWRIGPHPDSCDTSMACFLIENGAYVATRIPDRKLVFHFVCDSEFLKQQDALRITKSLVNNGCDPLQIVNSCGESLLHTAVQRGRDSLARYLISTLHVPLPPDILFIALRSASFNYDTFRNTDRLRMVYFLVEEGADVHARTSHGESVLHIALCTFRNNDECAFWVTRLLVDHGCDPAKVDSSGLTPLRVAVEQDLPSVVQYLQSLGADREQTAWSTGRDPDPSACSDAFLTARVEGGERVAPSNPQTRTMHETGGKRARDTSTEVDDSERQNKVRRCEQ